MAVHCSNCGKAYFVDPKKINYKGSQKAYFMCNNCHHKVIFDKFQLNSTHQKVPKNESTSMVSKLQYKKNENLDPPSIQVNIIRTLYFGLRMKMLVLFVVIPVLFMAFSNLFLLLQMKSLSKSITQQSTNSLTASGEKIIFEKARSVSQAVDLYLSTHPKLTKETFFQNKKFKEIALQKVGSTGYTLLVSKPDQNNPSRLWIHPRKELIGVDVVKTMKEVLLDEYKDWYEIQAKAFKYDAETGGYYTWLDKRLKFMAMVPVKNSDLFVASTAYIDEFTRPVNNLQKVSDQVTNRSLHISLVIILVTILTIGTISFFFGSQICKKISTLTTITENISVGDLDAQIPNYTRDEIGLLAEGIQRMQDSLKLSIERLRLSRLKLR